MSFSWLLEFGGIRSGVKSQYKLWQRPPLHVGDSGLLYVALLPVKLILREVCGVVSRLEGGQSETRYKLWVLVVQTATEKFQEV